MILNQETGIACWKSCLLCQHMLDACHAYNTYNHAGTILIVVIRVNIGSVIDYMYWPWLVAGLY